jgi:glyoxylase-like metal-dependent hydrolase (beta-lactamase superfamily II)
VAPTIRSTSSRWARVSASTSIPEQRHRARLTLRLAGSRRLPQDQRMRIHHLNCGSMHPVGFGKDHMICHCLLIETDAHGLVLVDTGFGKHDLEDPKARLGGSFARFVRPERDLAQAAISQVEARGFSPDDVRHVVLTHMDLDHVGGLVDFPAARVHVHAVEHADAMAQKSAKNRQRYRPVMWAHAPEFRTYSDLGEPWHGFAAVRQLDDLPPEILLVPLAGHTRGHTAVAVHGADGWLLHAGDAYFSRGEVHAEKRQGPPLLRAFQTLMEVDRKARLENQRRLRDLARSEPAVHIFSAHDPRELPA